MQKPLLSPGVWGVKLKPAGKARKLGSASAPASGVVDAPTIAFRPTCSSNGKLLDSIVGGRSKSIAGARHSGPATFTSDGAAGLLVSLGREL